MANALSFPGMLSARGASRIRRVIQRFSRGYWIFYISAFCMDLGFGLFFFLFNLYLTDLHFSERTIGQVIACLTLGNVAGTFPAMMLARRRGLRPLLMITFLCAPTLCALRVLILWVPAQFLLAFATGVALCGWPICFSPAIAALTNEENRSAGFSIAFATGIGLGTLAGVAGGFVPVMLHLSLVNGIRVVLLAACVLTLLGVLPLRSLVFPQDAQPKAKRTIRIHPFLFRFLPAFVLWNVVTGSFPVFGAVYLQKSLGMQLSSVGTVFSVSQLAQFGAVLAAPMLFKRTGISKGVAGIQIATAIFLVLIARTHSVSFAVCFYLLYFASQFMCSPGIYNLLMDSVPAEERSTASAFQNLSGALCQAGTAALTGICIVRFGYSAVLLGDAGVAILASILFWWLAASGQGRATEDDTAQDLCEPCAALQVQQVGE